MKVATEMLKSPAPIFMQTSLRKFIDYESCMIDVSAFQKFSFLVRSTIGIFDMHTIQSELIVLKNSRENTLKNKYNTG